MARPPSRYYPLDALYDITQGALDVGASAVLGPDGGAAKVIDVGTNNPNSDGTTNNRVDGTLVIDVSALEVDTGDELYTIIVQGGDTEAFDNEVANLAQLELGDATQLSGAGSHIDTPPGRYELHFSNEQAGVLWRYLRVYAVVAGTIGGNGLEIAQCWMAPQNLW